MPALAHQPATISVAGISFVHPDPRVVMTAKEWRLLGQAILLRSAGVESGARGVIAMLEQRLGVHDAHRRAVTEGAEAVTSKISRKAVVRAWEERQRAEVLQDPLRPVPTPQAVIEKMAEARRARLAAQTLRGANPRRNSAAVKKAIKEHEAVERLARKAAQDLMDAATTAHWARAAVKETESLAVGRGIQVAEEIVQTVEWLRDENGALIRDKSSQVGILRTERAVVRRMVSHDGLREAFERGDLVMDTGDFLVPDHRLWAVGRRYRDLYVTAENMLTPSKSEGGGCGFGPKGLQDHQVQAREKLAELRHGLPKRDMRGERLSIHNHPLAQKTVDVLDLIAGEDETVGTAAKTLKMDERTVKKHLRRGLFHCGENLDWW